MSANLNDWWARYIVGMLGQVDCDFAVLCPGNRNAPLLFALQGSGLDTLVHPEERSAAFMALGHTVVAGRPAAVCVTSGSAVANLLPALVEAHARGLPLILLSADRPAEEIGCGAPQTMTQPGIFASFVAAELNLPSPAIGAAADLVGRLGDCLGALEHGPVMINVPFDDPLPPLPDPAWVTPKGPPVMPIERVAATGWTIDPATVIPAADAVCGVIVAGADLPVPAAWITELAETTGWPLIADAISGCRSVGEPRLVTTADALLGGPLKDIEAEVLIRLGAAPLARTTWEWCGRQTCPVIRIDRTAPVRDWLHPTFLGLSRPTRQNWQSLLAACPPAPAEWTRRWTGADQDARRARDVYLADGWNESVAAAMTLEAPGQLLFVANSLPVRHANLLLDSGQTILANRGLAGIDGTIGTFLGALRARGGPGRLLIGDLAFLHDLPALAAAGGHPDGCTIVVLDNGGGAIFDLLPMTGLPGYERLVRAPAGLDLGATAASFGLTGHVATNRTSLAAALTASREQGGTHLVHVRLPFGEAGGYRTLVDRMRRGADTPDDA